jgi:hypothetical protein
VERVRLVAPADARSMSKVVQRRQIRLARGEYAPAPLGLSGRPVTLPLPESFILFTRL